MKIQLVTQPPWNKKRPEHPLRALAIAVSCLLVCAACEQEQRSSFSFYDDRIAPILDVGCQRQTTGCHVDDGNGFALGNLDLRSYDSLMRRADLLSAYGPYPVGALLLKAGNPADVDVRTIDAPDPSQPDHHRVRVTTDIRHGGGEGALAQGSRDYAALKQWIDGGHARNGVPSIELRKSSGACVHDLGNTDEVDISGDVKDPKSYARFVKEVQPILEERCAGSSCHGSSIADLHLTCGEGEKEQRWNYEVSVKHLDEVAASSELLRRPLAQQAGGAYHEGGDIFEDVDDPGYRTIKKWADDIAARAPQLLDFGPADDGLRFFANRVEPMLVRKGCMLQNCHSPAMFHDLRLRGGAQGSFSSIAIRRNYEMSRAMLAIDSPDPNQSRLIAKNLCPTAAGGVGVQHRGGALLEDFGGCALPETQAAPAQCDDVDADAGNLNEVPAYCVLTRWHEIEREAAITRGDIDDELGPSAVVFVTRPEGAASVLDFDTFKPGADLQIANATTDAAGHLELSSAQSLLDTCGLSSNVDIRGVSVSWDAAHIAFGARDAADAPLRIYEVEPSAASCRIVAGLSADANERDGILLHDFDPAYAPDGRLVFASTRGNAGEGPTRTPAALAPNSNLYVFDAKAKPVVRQLTFLSNHELSPSFMSDGRVIFTAEKRARDFHQVAARRINLDGGDYHPLIAQRPSIGFESATEVVELPNRNFAFVAASLTAADGGGSIVVVNRSIGPDQFDRDPEDRAYVHALTTPVPGALGGDRGAFRSPSPLPSGRLLAACDVGVTNLEQGPHHYALCEIDPSAREEPRMLWQDAQSIVVESRAVWPRLARPAFTSRADEANGSTRIDTGADDAIVHVTDFPMLATLMFANTREGRPIPKSFARVEVFESRPAPADATSFSGLGARSVEDDFGTFYEELRSLGRAELEADGSLRMRLPGGTPLTLELQAEDGKALRFAKNDPLEGPMRQREEMQFYPGERARQSMKRDLFDGVCAGCHGSITGRELDVVVDVDVLTSASKTLADDDLVDLR